MQIGIVGSGTMGSGIAQAFAMHEGYQVLLCDVSREVAARGADNIAARLAKLEAGGKLTKEAAGAARARIRPAEKAELEKADLVIEAALENLEIKRELFRFLQGICSKDAIFASNTSSISLAEIGYGLDRPVVGVHFFNPAATMKLVEIIVCINTPPETVKRVKEIVRSIGKQPVEVTDSPGFAVNRLLIPMINDAVGVFAERLASAEDIDTAMKLGAHHPMGPLALGDLIGLDVCLAIMEVMHQETGDDKYRPHPLLRKMVRGDRLGRKTGRGFYQYAAR